MVGASTSSEAQNVPALVDSTLFVYESRVYLVNHQDGRLFVSIFVLGRRKGYLSAIADNLAFDNKLRLVSKQILDNGHVVIHLFLVQENYLGTTCLPCHKHCLQESWNYPTLSVARRERDNQLRDLILAGLVHMVSGCRGEASLVIVWLKVGLLELLSRAMYKIKNVFHELVIYHRVAEAHFLQEAAYALCVMVLCRSRDLGVILEFFY